MCLFIYELIANLIHMELLPCDCLGVIYSFIRDKDYINFTSTSKYFHSLIKYNLKIMTNQHKLSKLTWAKHFYFFTNILYDFILMNSAQIPSTITEITFFDEFHANFDELREFKHLKKIHIGMFYWDLSYNNFPNILNKQELVMTIITNKVFACLFSTYPLQLYVNIKNNWFLNKFKQMFQLNYDMYKRFQTVIKHTNDIYQLDFNLMNSINRCINTMDENEIYYFKKDVLEISNDYPNYLKFLVFHIDLILEYLTKLKIMVCERNEKIRIEFYGEGDKLQDIKRYLSS